MFQINIAILSIAIRFLFSCCFVRLVETGILTQGFNGTRLFNWKQVSFVY